MSRTSILALTAIAALGTTCLVPVDAFARGHGGYGGHGGARAVHSRPSHGISRVGRPMIAPRAFSRPTLRSPGRTRVGAFSGCHRHHCPGSGTVSGTPGSKPGSGTVSGTPRPPHHPPIFVHPPHHPPVDIPPGHPHPHPVGSGGGGGTATGTGVGGGSTATGTGVGGGSTATGTGIPPSTIPPSTGGGYGTGTRPCPAYAAGCRPAATGYVAGYSNPPAYQLKAIALSWNADGRWVAQKSPSLDVARSITINLCNGQFGSCILSEAEVPETRFACLAVVRSNEDPTRLFAATGNSLDEANAAVTQQVSGAGMTATAEYGQCNNS